MGRGRLGRQRWWGVAVAAVLSGGVLPTLPAAAAAPVAAVAASERSGDTGSSLAVSEGEALRQARKSGEPVEVVSQRGESREVFATADGNLEAREYLRPVWTRSDKDWKRINTTLARRSDGSVAPATTAVELAFSGGGDKQPLVRMERAGRAASLTWPASLPTPVLDGAVATYESVLPGVDLQMTAQEDGFSQLLVVKTAEAAQSRELDELRLKLGVEGVDVRETEGGGLRAVDHGGGGTVFEAPQPLMWDSSKGAPQTAKALTTADDDGSVGDRGEPGAAESGRLAPVGVDVTPDDELVLTPDTDVLKGEDTAYPVFIDPQWSSPRATAWTMASKYWASSPQWKFNGESDAGMGYCNWSYCQPNDTKRLFYRIPVSTFSGKTILSAEFVVRNTWSASCTKKSVELWETKGISSSTTWNSQDASGFWIKRIALDSFAYGYSGCSAKDAEFGVRSAVQSAANAHDSTMTFGLKAEEEDDPYAWKRFSTKAFLRVKYNRPPAQLKASQLTMQYGGTCKSSSNPARVRTLGEIRANNVRDPDGDNVSVQFQAKWDGGSWKPDKTTSSPSGSDFSISLPSTIPKNTNVNWYARVWDGGQYSPWSYAGDPQACYFIYDTTVPKAPTVTSGQYPESNSNDPDDPWYDGVGQYGSFTIDSSSTDVTTYWYGINNDPSAKNKITTSGGAAKIAQVLPSKPGVNFVTAQAFDSAGNGSEIHTYQFRVKAGQPARATWQLDEEAGASEAKGSTPARTLALHGGATPGVEGVDGTAVEFNGIDAYASTDLSPVNTSGGFAVSAWVKLDKIPAATADVALIPGNSAPGMELYYSSTYGWSFNQYKSDDSSGGLVRAAQGDTSKVKAGTWTHLVGSYSSTNDLLQLFVDGQLAESVPYDAPWTARRGLQVGGKNLTGTPVSFFPGAIDALQIFDKPLAQDEVDKLRAKQSVGDPGRPAIAVFDLDEAADATDLAGHGGVLPAKYNGTVTTGVEGIAGKATKFNGTSGYAKIGQTSGPHINTERSFTVSAWAKLDKKPAGAAVITAQAGKNAPGFELYYSAAYDRWAFNQYSSDSADATPVRAMQADGTSARAGEWVHLVGVHDTTANTLTLYVNGVKAGTQTLVDAFYADQSMYIGSSNYTGSMGAYFPGTIDDVRVMDRPASAEEVAQMFRQRPLVRARWNFETVTDSTPATSPDSSDNANSMTLGAQAQQGMGWIDFNGLQLDGVDDYASAGSQPLDTSASFTVTAWAQAAALPTHNASVVSAAGTHTSAFDLHFTPDTTNADGMGSYSADIRAGDEAGASTGSVSNTEFYDARDWNHLALVYDGFAKEARLYVNGVLQETACTDTDGNGDADDTSCQDLIAWADNILAFKAGSTLQVGRAKTADAFGQYFPGVIDDVWAFQGALNDSQIIELAGSFFDIPTDVPSGS
ncbi:LamG-like jellyroll fold domain-containing protein [Streptomyces griseoaurantiacus]|uniref:LamG-like jellyroll fold domain-containing protein n=1 Tax=Streptomyces griseoaurantiacus TaxID=68213 RepID=UPI003461727C